ncbi:hypothetical protein FACS1894211_10530 [Clostridia bacterium]|nr:hypothetical protein FACS1894211_10530 [Clostridia bacterium]
MNTFGSNLKTIREENKLTQCQLAALLHTSQARVSEWELNKIEPTLYNILRLMQVLNTSFEELTENIQRPVV